MNSQTGLPAADALRIVMLAGECPFCLMGPFRALSHHLRWCTQNVPYRNASELRQLAGLNRGTALQDPELSLRRSVAMRGIRPKGTARYASGYSIRAEGLTNIAKARTDPSRVPLKKRGEHGKSHTYRHGCRCLLCRRANTEKVAANSRARAIKLGDLNHPQPEHGTASTYTNWKCRCDTCSAAHRGKMDDSSRRRRWQERAAS